MRTHKTCRLRPQKVQWMCISFVQSTPQNGQVMHYIQELTVLTPAIVGMWNFLKVAQSWSFQQLWGVIPSSAENLCALKFQTRLIPGASTMVILLDNASREWINRRLSAPIQWILITLELNETKHVWVFGVSNSFTQICQQEYVDESIFSGLNSVTRLFFLLVLI